MVRGAALLLLTMSGYFLINPDHPEPVEGPEYCEAFAEQCIEGVRTFILEVAT